MSIEVQLKPTYQPDIYKSYFPAAGSRLVYGTSGLGGVWGEVNPEESVDCLLYAFENGITSIDTSPSYNNSEEYVGKALKCWNGEKPFVSTKVGRLKTQGAFEVALDYGPQGMHDSVKRSLDLLGVDSVDLLFLHEPQWVPMDRIEEVLETLLSFKEMGYAKMLGVGGNPTPEFMPYITRGVFDAISTFCKIDACNLTFFKNELPYIQSQDISIYAASALHFSLLGNRFDSYVKELPKESGITSQDVENAKKVNIIAKREGLALSTLAQRYLFSIKDATRIVMGARNIKQITSTISDWRMGAIREDLFNEITEVVLAADS